MYMRFVKMIQFTLLVKAEGRLREFNFRKLKNPDEEIFSVNVCNERGDRIVFNMQRKENDWRIMSSQIPGWILQSEKGLSEAIGDELRNW